MNSYDPLDINGQAEEKKRKERRERLARKDEEDDIKWLMSSKRGRRILWRLMDQAGVFRLSYHPTAMQMAFNEGNRNLGNKTLDMILTHASEQFSTMMKENTDARRTDSNDAPNQ